MTLLSHDPFKVQVLNLGVVTPKGAVNIFFPEWGESLQLCSAAIIFIFVIFNMAYTTLFYFNLLGAQVDKCNMNCKQPKVLSYFCDPLCGFSFYDLPLLCPPVGGGIRIQIPHV